VTQSGELNKSGNLKSLIETESIFTLPADLKNYQPMMEKGYKVEWVGWKNDGSKFDDNNICPFCTAALKATYEKEKRLFSTSYKQSNVKNINETLSYFEGVKEYMNETKKEKLYACIRKTTDVKEMLFMIKTFRSELEFLIDKITSVEQFNSYRVRSEDISKLGEQLKELLINPSALDIFNSKRVVELIDFINKKVQGVITETDSLKADIGQLEGMIGKSKKEAKKNINEFLVTADMNYEFEIIDEGENVSKTILKYKSRTKDLIEVADINVHLSWGERNAFALVLFMHYALSQNPDIIILDDPISSFDSNKKFAIMNHLFSGSKSFSKKTVLMLTHDMQPIIDFVYNKLPQTESVSAYFLQNNGGVIAEKSISREDIKPLPTLLSENCKNPQLNIIHRITSLRKLLELMPDGIATNDSAYNLLSSLLHGKSKPDHNDEIELTKEEIKAGEKFIKQYIADFDYDNYLKNIIVKEYLLDSFEKEKNSYFRLQVFRVLLSVLNPKPKIDDKPLLKYINEQFHVENDYMFSLDFVKYDIVPDFVIPECDDYLKKENLVSGTK
jgi:hypothetical protein